MELTIAQRRVGTEEPSPESIVLKAGALTADLVAGGLRTIRYQGREVLRAVAYVVRDKDWGTYHPAISDFSCRQGVDDFTVTFRARCTSVEPSQELEYETRITGNANGLITFDVTAEPRTPFLTARCGFAILHPLEGVVGQPAIIEHVDGSREHAAFPDLIAPIQPFKEIRAIEHQVAPGVTARCLMTGDVFEMEDQRNWSDASYKTYVRPLALPWPYVMESGVRNHQSVELLITDSGAGRHQEETKVDVPIEVQIGEPDGTFPQIGVAIHPSEIATILAHPGMLQRLQPQLLLFHFDPTAGPIAGDGPEHLAGFREIAQIADASQCALELVLPAQRNVKDELSEIAAMVSAANLKLSAVLVSPAVDRKSTLPGSQWPPCPPLAEIYQAAREAFPGVAIGGGMLTYFTELNRKRPPVEFLDFVSHCTCPIVHAADDLSVMQTLETMPSITRSARAIVGNDKPYWIGPSTIGMRQNPIRLAGDGQPGESPDYDDGPRSKADEPFRGSLDDRLRRVHRRSASAGTYGRRRNGTFGTRVRQRSGRGRLPSGFLHGARSFRHRWTPAISLPVEPSGYYCCRSRHGSRWEPSDLACQPHWPESGRDSCRR